MFSEFKKFALRGNVVDLAVGIIIGVAFGKIVASLVADVIMPPVGLLLGGVDFTDFFLVLSGPAAETLAQAEEAGAVTLAYGRFVNTVIEFVIVAFAVFLLVKGMNRLMAKEEAKPAEPPKPSNEEVLLGEIRDLLKAQAGK